MGQGQLQLLELLDNRGEPRVTCGGVRGLELVLGTY